MAFRDRIDKLISYIGIDDLGEEEEEILETKEPVASPTPQVHEQVTVDPLPTPTTNPNRPRAPKTKPVHQASAGTVPRPEPTRVEQVPQPTSLPARPEKPRQDGPRFPERAQAPTSRPNQQVSRQTAQESVQPSQQAQQDQPIQLGQTQIAIKHPLRYEDTEDLAQAFLLGQCVLVDFEYMQDVQARRCIDFLTGACLVAQGSFQRVGATMFLLTPKGVVVTKEDALSQQPVQDVPYNYDLKRR